MKRHRVLVMGYDMRPNLLSHEIKPEWAPAVRDAHLKSRGQILAGLRLQFGEANFERKLQNFQDLGVDPISIFAFHNIFLREIRQAFVMGSYYPALTGVCALGERILNHLVRVLRDDYRTTPEYRKVAGKDSFDDWNISIRTLASWGVLLPSVAESFRKLRFVRHRSLHFSPDVEGDVRRQALDAVNLFQRIIGEQFGVWGPWHIPNDAGLSLVRKDAEAQPFVRRLVVPNCAYVGPEHDLHPAPNGRWIVTDREDYPDEKIEDDEWVRRFKAAPHAGVQAGGHVQIAITSA
jgi:hypothetical protein